MKYLDSIIDGAFRGAFWAVIALTIVVIAGGCEMVKAADYYVSPAGRDANPGTQAAPKGTLDWCRSAGVLRPGDRVYVDGTHKLYLYEGVAGTQAAPIVFEPWPGKSPVLGNQQFAIRLWPAVSWVTIRGFEIRDCEYSLAGDPAPSAAKPWTGIRLEDCEIHHADHGPRLFWGRDIAVADCLIHDLRVNGLQFRDCERVLVQDCKIWNVSDGKPPDSSDADCVHTYGGTRFQFTNVQVWGASEDGFDLNCSASFRDCISHDHAGAGLKIWRRSWDGYADHSATLDNCLIYRCGLYPPDPADGNPGIKVSEGAGLIARRCTIFAGHDNGVQANATTRTQLPVSISDSIIAGTLAGYGVSGRAACSGNVYWQNRAGNLSGPSDSTMLVADPLFALPGFVLQAGSPAAGKGWSPSPNTTPPVIPLPTTQPTIPPPPVTTPAITEADVRRIVREEIARSKVVPNQ